MNKKTWHPGRMDNQEKVWKKEEDARKESSRLEDLRTQLEEERQREELLSVAQAAGHKLKSDRLDWMYQGGMLARAEAEKRNEEAMLAGKPVTLGTAAEEATRLEQSVTLPSFYSEDTPASANESWARLHSDPLFAIRQQEIGARKQIAKNPVQMESIKAEVERLKAAATGKQDKKDSKKVRKEAKAARKEQRKAGKQMAAALGPQALQAPGQALTNHLAIKQEERETLSWQHGRRRSCSASPRPSKHRRLDGGPPPARHSRRHDLRSPLSSSHRLPSDQNGHHVPHERRASRHEEAERLHHSNRDGHQADRHCKSSRHVEHKAMQGQQRRDADFKAEPREILVKHEAMDQPATGPRYGLTMHEQARLGQDRESATDATKRRIQEAVHLREEEAAAAKAALAGKRADHRTGRLTEEEKRARLAEMVGDASLHDGQRWDRLHKARVKEEEELQATGPGGPSDGARFLKEAHKNLYGANGEASSLEDRVGRRKFYNDHGEGAAFRR